MKQTETLQEHEFRLKQLAKNSKDNSKQFTYIAKGLSRIIINNDKICKSNCKQLNLCNLKN